MYSFLFRKIPGPLWVRIALSIIILAAVLFVLVTFVFPFVSEQLNDSTIGAAGFADDTPTGL